MIFPSLSAYMGQPVAEQRPPPERYKLIDPETLKARLADIPAPGEFELLDAINLMERGDYSGAVRRITTAIEVVVEARLFQVMEAKNGKAEAEKFLRRTRSRFDDRIKAYQRLSQRNFPDALTKDLSATRILRHNIVHGGYRIGPEERGRAQRCVDMGRWIFNWFENDEGRKQIRERKVAFRSLGRDIFGFPSKIVPEGAILSPIRSAPGS